MESEPQGQRLPLRCFELVIPERRAWVMLNPATNLYDWLQEREPDLNFYTGPTIGTKIRQGTKWEDIAQPGLIISARFPEDYEDEDSEDEDAKDVEKLCG